MTLDEFITKAKASAIGHGTIEMIGRKYSYDILPADFEPRVPYFVGYPKGEYFFLSAEVPQDFREALLRHELWCHRQKERGDTEHCRHAAVYELIYVPKDRFKEYYEMRIKMFDALLELYKESEDFVRTATASRDQFRFLLESQR